MRGFIALAAFAATALNAAPVLAEESGITLRIVDREAYPGLAEDAGVLSEYSAWLADQDDRTVYLFSADTRGDADTDPTIACTGECLEAWPPVYTDGEPRADVGINEEEVGTVEHEGRMMVTYQGWPLYYFAEDEDAGAPQGHAVEAHGGTWYVVQPVDQDLPGEGMDPVRPE